jgi:hypothetical protein
MMQAVLSLTNLGITVSIFRKNKIAKWGMSSNDAALVEWQSREAPFFASLSAAIGRDHDRLRRLMKTNEVKRF